MSRSRTAQRARANPQPAFAPLPRPYALERWRLQTQGIPKGGPFDRLRAAACWEIRGREFELSGDRTTAATYYDMTRLRLAGYQTLTLGDVGLPLVREVLEMLRQLDPPPPPAPPDPVQMERLQRLAARGREYLR